MKAEISLTPFKAAIFDMDGTMIDNMAYHKKAWQEFFRRHGMVLDDEDFKQNISGKTNARIFEHVFGKELAPGDLEAFTEEKEAVYRGIYGPHIKEIEGLSRVIEELGEQGIKLAIATSAPVKNREFALEVLGLRDTFAVILGDEHATEGKPHPEIYLSAARELGVSPDKCIVFEDSPPGVQAGKNAGMVVVGILSSHSEGELDLADYKVRDFSEIIFMTR